MSLRFTEQDLAVYQDRQKSWQKTPSISPTLQSAIDAANVKVGKKKRASAFKHRVQIGRSTIMLTDEGLEQYTVAQWLRYKEILFLHIPNERRCSVQEMVMLKALGLEPGANDLLIFDVTTRMEIEGHRGIAIEMKSLTGTARPNQIGWSDRMKSCYWLTVVCRGADEAITFLKEWGF